MNDKAHKIFVIIQWVLIAGLIVLCLFYKNSSFKLKQDIIQITDKNTAVITYQTSEISKLKEKNEELYNQYKNDKQVEYIVQYKYKAKKDTVFIKPTQIPSEGDSIQKWAYASKSNYFDYEIGVYAEEKPDSVSFNFELNDTLTVVNKKLYDGVYQTYINAQSQNPIEPIVVYKKKASFWEKFSIGPEVGVGYGVFNKQPDVFVGFGVTYKINK